MLWLTLTPSLSHQGRGRNNFHGSRLGMGDYFDFGTGWAVSLGAVLLFASS